MKVKAWNQYSILNGVETGRVVCATDHDQQHLALAMNEAERYARAWNRKENRPDMRVNFLTCGGYIRSL